MAGRANAPLLAELSQILRQLLTRTILDIRRILNGKQHGIIGRESTVKFWGNNAFTVLKYKKLERH